MQVISSHLTRIGQWEEPFRSVEMCAVSHGALNGARYVSCVKRIQMDLEVDGIHNDVLVCDSDWICGEVGHQTGHVNCAVDLYGFRTAA